MSETLKIGIISGVISSIIATILIAVFVLFFRKIFVPWLREVLYSGINLEDRWKACGNKDDYSWVSVMSLKQNGSLLEGEIILQNSFKKMSNEDKEIFFNFAISGKILDGRVLVTYQAKFSENTDMGALLLRVADGGKSLVGSVVFTSDSTYYDSNDIIGFGITENIEFKRS